MTINVRNFEHIFVDYPVHRKGKDAFTPSIKIPVGFSDINSQIMEYEQEFDRYILSESDYFELVNDAFSNNIHYSTELEGNPLTLKEVQKITRNTFNGVPEVEPDSPVQEIINHLATWLFPDFYSRPWSLDKILLSHHFITMQDPGSKPGVLRSASDEGRATVGIGEDIYFYATDGRRVLQEMDSLMSWLNSYSNGYNPIVAASALFHEFESIHPFHDGNGRTGRTLFHGYLQCSGLPNSSLCKIEQQLVKTKRTRELYYDILAWTDMTLDYVDLIDYMSQAILESYKEADKKLSQKDLLNKGLNETAKRLLIKAKKENRWFTISEAAAWVDGRSSATVRKHLNELVELGALRTEGRTNAKKYQFANPLNDIRKNVGKVKGSTITDPKWGLAGH